MRASPPAWMQATLSSVAEVVRGVTYSSKDAVASPAAGCLPILRATNIGDALSLDSEMVYVPERFVRPAQRMQLGDIVVASSSGSLSVVGKSAQLLQPWEGGFGAFCAVIRPSRHLAPAYLAYLVSSSSVRSVWREQAKGTSINNLKSSDILSGVIPIPPVVEQQRIVATIEEQLSRLDVGVTALARARQGLKRLRTTVLHTAVTEELANSGPDAWEHVQLGELLESIDSGKSFKCDERPARPEEWGVVKVSAMTWGEFRPYENKTVLADRKIDPRMEIHSGDILVSRANTVDHVGAVVLVGNCRPRLLLSDKSLRLTLGPRLLPDWLVTVLRSAAARLYIESVATGTSDSMRNISQAKLRSLTVPLPPVSVQTRLTEDINRRMSLIVRLEAELIACEKSVAALRSAILAAAFSGKLVPQDPNDEPASTLLARIAAERESAARQHPTKPRKPRRKVTT